MRCSNRRVRSAANIDSCASAKWKKKSQATWTEARSGTQLCGDRTGARVHCRVFSPRSCIWILSFLSLFQKRTLSKQHLSYINKLIKVPCKRTRSKTPRGSQITENLVFGPQTSMSLSGWIISVYTDESVKKLKSAEGWFLVLDFTLLLHSFAFYSNVFTNWSWADRSNSVSSRKHHY